jgi:dTDP-4-dehydrorhamnose reductase
VIKANRNANPIVILGAGFVAQAYCRALYHLGYYPIIFSRSWMDYADPSVVRYNLSACRARIVINAAGYTGDTVDDCEANKAECYRANVTLPVNVAKVCKELSLPLIQISSGCIFNGDGPFVEKDDPKHLPKQQSFYATCKRQAELGIEDVGGSVFIFRIRMPFSHIHHRRNWLLKLCDYPLILDGLNSATFIEEFAMRSWQLAEKGAPGVYHCVQPEPIRTAEVARMLHVAGLRKLAVECWNPEDFSQHHCKRSAAVLNCAQFETAYKAPSTPTRSAIEWCIEQLVKTIQR